MSKKVKLRTVLKWTCLDCGRDNIEDPPVMMMTEEEKDFFGCGVYSMVPETVLCQCLSMFDTEEGEEFDEV